MGQTVKNGLDCVKWVTLWKMSHTVKNGLHFKKWVTLWNMGRTLQNGSHQEPITRSLQLPPSSRHGVLTDRCIFSLNFYSDSDSHRNISNQLQSQVRANVDMSTWYWHVHMRPHCFTVTGACSCRLELVYFAEKYRKIDWSLKMAY